MQFLRGICSSAWPMFSSSSVLISYVVICALMAGLQIQCVAAEDIPSHKTSAEDQLQEILANEKYYEYDEGLEDDNEEVDPLRDDGLLTKDELQDLQYAKDHYKKPSSRAEISATINGTTIVNVGNTYTFYSHDDFSVLRYSSNYMRYFNFVRGPSVESIEIYCYYFRIERSYSCYKDRVVIYAPPPGPRTRFCGKRHGFYRKYYSDVWWVFITDDGTRKPGFCCEITPIPFQITVPPPCCQQTPTVPAVRQVVNSCADLLPGYPYCTCTEVDDCLCLICSFCENCHLEFLAVHDFSQTSLYIYFEFPCNNCTMDLATNSYGYELSVKGYVDCLNLIPTVTLPTYPSSALVVAIFCPASSFDVCGYFQSQAGKKLLLHNEQEEGTKNLVMGTASHAKSCGSMHLVILEDTFDFSLVNNPECFGTVRITGAPCSNFTQNGIIDLTAFINIQTISLNLCTPSLSCGSIIVNSPTIQEVSVSDTTSCNSSCLVTNQATSPSPTIIGC